MKLKDWASAAEIIASIAVVLSLAFLVLEVRGNTRALERQASLERFARIVDPYISASEVPRIYAKIKAVDGMDPLVSAYVERYGLEVEEAVTWQMMAYRIWLGHQADFINDGPSARLGSALRFDLSFTDTQLFLQLVIESFEPEFQAYLKSICEIPTELASCSSSYDIWGKRAAKQP